MASDRLQGLEAIFVFGSGLLPPVSGKFLCLSTMLEGAGLLFRAVPVRRSAPMSPGEAAKVPADSEGEEGPLSGRKPPPARGKQKEE